MNNKKKIPVVWGLDKKYVLQSFVVMHSILSHSKERYHFFIITTDAIEKQVHIYEERLKKIYDNFEIAIIQVQSDLFAHAVIHNEHLSVAAYFRLLIPDMLCEYDKCIYLDCDLLVNGDLSQLFNINISDYYLAGVKDCHIIEDTPKEKMHKKVLGLPVMDKYVNSGVLLINLNKMRDDEMVSKFFIQMRKENWFEDQDILNYCCYPYIKTLPLKYNLFHFYYGKSIQILYDRYEKEDFDFEEPYILHMGGKWKPWLDKRIKGANQWWKYAALYENTEYYQIYQKLSSKKNGLEYLVSILDKNKQRKLVVWGFSRNGCQLCDMLITRNYSNIIAITDNNKEKWGKEYRGIPVMEPQNLLENYNNILWLVSNWVAFEDIELQIQEYGVRKEDIIRYKDFFKDRRDLLVLDEVAYDSEIDRIAEFEYLTEYEKFEDRKQYIMRILSKPQYYQEEYKYLDARYHFRLWFHMRSKEFDEI